MKADLERTIARLIATCACDACERYRKWYSARAAEYAVAIEESLKRGPR